MYSDFDLDFLPFPFCLAFVLQAFPSVKTCTCEIRRKIYSYRHFHYSIALINLSQLILSSSTFNGGEPLSFSFSFSRSSSLENGVHSMEKYTFLLSWIHTFEISLWKSIHMIITVLMAIIIRSLCVKTLANIQYATISICYHIQSNKWMKRNRNNEEHSTKPPLQCVIVWKLEYDFH